MSSLQGQWEVSKTTFKTFGQLRDLISIASQPNVQPQAVLAAEELGFGLIASPKRIDEAIVALGGNDSTRVESVQALVGLSSSDLQRVIRQSTSLLQFFLPITACKPCYVDGELGDLAFEMMVQASVLKSFPVAPSQLAQLIKTFSGQAESIVPITVMHEIASAVDNHSPGPDIYKRMDTKVLAQILIRIFANLRDETVLEMVLTGHNHGIWLATVFSWLLPERVHVTVGDDATIRGSAGMKLTISIEAVNSAPWELDIWKSDVDPTHHVFESDNDDMDQIHRLPIQQAKSYFDQYYCSAFEDRVTRQKAIVAIGSVAGALTCLLAEAGKLFLSKRCCQDGGPKCATTSFLNVMSKESLSQYPNTITKYGWSEINPGQEKAYEYFHGCITHIRDTTLPKEVMKHLEVAASLFIKDAVGDDIETSYILDPACYIALNAIATSTVKLTGGKRYFNPLTSALLSETDEAVGTLLCKYGMEVQDFRKLAFTHLMPGLDPNQVDKHDLIIAENGYVAGMAVLWQCSTLQRDVLAIRYSQGHIQKDGVTYDRVREADFLSVTFRAFGQEPITLFERGKYLGLSPKTENLSFNTRTSLQGNRIMIKQYMERSKLNSAGKNELSLLKGQSQEKQTKGFLDMFDRCPGHRYTCESWT